MSRSTLLRFGSIAAVASLITLTSAVLSAQAKKASAGAYFTDKYPNLFLRRVNRRQRLRLPTSNSSMVIRNNRRLALTPAPTRMGR
jgi:hypothetical protein